MAIIIISIPLIIIPLSLYFDYILISGTPISISEIIIDLAYMFPYNKKTPSLSFRITKADLSSVVPLCIIIPVTRYNLLTLSKPNSFSCNVKTTSRLTIDFSGMLPGDITKSVLSLRTTQRLSEIAFSFVTYPFHCISFL